LCRPQDLFVLCSLVSMRSGPQEQHIHVTNDRQLSSLRRARLVQLKCCEDAKNALEAKLKARFGHGGLKEWDECSVASEAIRREVNDFAESAPLTKANVARLDSRLRHKAKIAAGCEPSVANSTVYTAGCSCASGGFMSQAGRSRQCVGDIKGSHSSVGRMRGRQDLPAELSAMLEAQFNLLQTKSSKAGGRTRSSTGFRRLALTDNSPLQSDRVCGHCWAGPPKPKKAENLTLKKGSKVLPHERVRMDGTTYHDFGLQRPRYYDEVKRAFNRTFARGTLVLPNGPMEIDGTTQNELGSMYTWLGATSDA